MLLSVENLKVKYGNIEALHGISFNVEEGEIVTLIGANGAGKTTSLHSICRLPPPEAPKVVEGDILFKGESILGTEPQNSIYLEFDRSGYPVFVTEYFEYEHGSSTTGRVDYPLHSGFAPGEHSVIVRAFDNLGNQLALRFFRPGTPAYQQAQAAAERDAREEQRRPGGLPAGLGRFLRAVVAREITSSGSRYLRLTCVSSPRMRMSASPPGSSGFASCLFTRSIGQTSDHCSRPEIRYRARRVAAATNRPFSRRPSSLPLAAQAAVNNTTS